MKPMFDDLPNAEPPVGSQGLWRTILGGAGRSLADASAKIAYSSCIDQVTWHPLETQ
jgi:hypothetical protein